MASTTISLPWSDLPSDLIALIAENLTANMADYIRFRAVCTAWRSSTIDPRKCHHPTQLPWLIDCYNKTNHSISFVSFDDGKKHSIALPPSTKGNCVTGSYNGWLVLAKHDEPCNISLINPITRAQVQPPSMLNIRRVKELYDIEVLPLVLNTVEESITLVLGLAMTSRPDSNEGCTLVVCLACMPLLLSWRTTDSSWTLIDDSGVCYRDVIYLVGCFFAMTKHGDQLVVFNSEFNKVNCMISAPEQILIPQDMVLWRLMELSGELLLFRKIYDTFDDNKEVSAYSWKKVDVFQLELIDGKCCWSELKNLEDKIIFLGAGCHPISLPIVNCPFAASSDIIYISTVCFYNFWVKHGVYSLKDETMSDQLPFANLLCDNGYYASKWHSPRYY